MRNGARLLAVETIATVLGLILLIIGATALFDGHSELSIPLLSGGVGVFMLGIFAHASAAIYQEHNLPGIVMLFSMTAFGGFAFAWIFIKSDDPRGPALINFMVGLIGFITGIGFRKMTIHVAKGPEHDGL